MNPPDAYTWPGVTSHLAWARRRLDTWRDRAFDLAVKNNQLQDRIDDLEAETTSSHAASSTSSTTAPTPPASDLTQPGDDMPHVDDRSWAAAHALRTAAQELEDNPGADPVKFLRGLADALYPEESA